VSRVEALRAKIPGPVRPFTRGVWPYVWVAALSFLALWMLGGETFDATMASREQTATQRRLVRAMRDAAASEEAERARVDALATWVREDGPARVRAQSVQIGLSRLQEKVAALVTGVGEGARLMQSDRGGVQVEPLVESLPGGGSLHLVRLPLNVQTDTMEQMARVIEAIESNGEVWLRPGNATLTSFRTRDGTSARLTIAQVWAVLEVAGEGT